MRNRKLTCPSRAPVASSLFLSHNTALAPPYRVLIDTNFINFSLQNKIELVAGMMDCLYAKCEFVYNVFYSTGILTSHRYSVCHGLCHGGIGKARTPISNSVTVCQYAQPFEPNSQTPCIRVARDPRFERLKCSHEGTYADDCLVQRVTAHKCFIVATCDRELRRRIRKVSIPTSVFWCHNSFSLQVPGVPLMYIVQRKYAIERLPDQGAPS